LRVGIYSPIKVEIAGDSKMTNGLGEKRPLLLGILLVLVLLMAAVFAGCTSDDEDEEDDDEEGDGDGDLSGEITITGSTTVLPIAEALKEKFEKEHADVTIQVSGGGSSTGVTDVGEGNSDIGMASRDIKDSEMEKYPDLVATVIAKDGIAVIIHTDNTVTELTVDQILDIYSGATTNWKDVGGADEEIVLVGRDSASGTRASFEELVMDDNDVAATMLEKNSNGAVYESITATPGAIGYVGLGYVDAGVTGVKVDGVEPSIDTVLDGSYPISRSLNMITLGEADGLAKAFIDYVLSPVGQAAVIEEGFVNIGETDGAEGEGEGEGEGEEELSGELTLTGSTTVLPIAEAAKVEFEALHPKVTVQVSGGGSSTGVTDAGEGNNDIGMASREVKDSEMEKYPDIKATVIAKDGIALIAHKDNTVSDLSVEQIRQIYMGEITNWADVGGEDLEIVLIGRDSASGTRASFEDLVMDDNDVAATMLEKNSNGAVHESVSSTPGAIGYVGLGYVDDKVKGLMVDGVAPSVDTVLDGSYPIARSLNMVTLGEPDGLAKAFIDWVLSDDGQAIVEEEGFVPL